ncbi:MAG: hypothetical protein GY768_31840 [Planctomycetaceae bacterium]|nr:hypothetical protein [Planctomycetaceae bacterium]
MNRQRWTFGGLTNRSRGQRAVHHALRNSMVEQLEARHLLAGDLSISEFQAINSTTVADEDGDFEDWIEIRNAGVESANLDGWYLTDDDTELDKWEFPAVSIDAGAQIVVFASNKDRTDPNSPLHTNFKLAGNGEYLALVKPDGTVAQDFGEQYRPQFEDQSFGLAIGRETIELLDGSDAVRATVPLDNGLGDEWIQPAFNDEGWFQGNQGIGYEIARPGFELQDDFDGVLDPAWNVDIPAEGTSTVELVDGKLRLDVPARQDTSWEARGLAPVVTRELPGDGPGDWEVVTRVSQRSSDRGVAGIGVVDATTGKLQIQFEYSSRLSFRLIAGGDSQGSRVSVNRTDYYLRLARDGKTQTWSAFYKLDAADDWNLVATAKDGVDNTPVVDQPLFAFYGRTPASGIRADFDYAQFIVPDQQPVYGPEIGLNLGNEMFNNNASAYLRIPFEVEGDPSRFDELALTARYDDGFRAFLNGVLITEQNVPIESTWNSSATSAFGAVNGQIPSVQINVSAFIDALKPSENLLAVQAMNLNSLDRDFFFDALLSGAEILEETPQFFIVPTPGEPNDLPAAPSPVLIAEQGVFFGSQTIELQLEEPNPALGIFYTLNGTDPTPNSTRYVGPIVLTESAMLQAKSFDISANRSYDPSNPISGTFFAASESLRGRDSDIPLVILDSLGQGLPGSGSTSLRPVNVIFYDVSKASGRSELDGLVEYLGRGGVRDRGSSTAGQPKPNMTFEVWGADGTTQDDDTDVSLAGMPAESDWVLHAPYNFDRALIRNPFFMGLSHEIDVWASHTRFVEVYFNRNNGVVEERDYAGTYILMEKVTRGPDRVDITGISREDNDPNSEEISGGYIWKVDRADPGEPTFSAGGQGINWVDPKSPRGRADEDQKATAEQEDWVQDYINAFRDTLRNPDINDPDGYSKYINVDSWIDQHLINVLTFNVDAFRLSAYFHKDRGKPMEYGPLWDCDRCMESTDNRDDDPTVWTNSSGTNFFSYTWFRELFQDPGFWQAYIDRWQQLRKDEYSNDNIDTMIDRLADEVRESAARNIERWSSASRYRSNSAYPSGKLDRTFQGEIEHMRAWLHARAEFMDHNFVQPVSVRLNGEELGQEKGVIIEAGSEVQLVGPSVVSFDNPALILGGPGEAISTYFVPVNDELGTDWSASDFDDSQWQSGPLGIGFDTGDDFLELIRTTVRPSETHPDATTILNRLEFNIDDVDALADNGLALRMKYDDGFVAYLNGEEILRINLRDSDLAWDSRARSHRDSEAVLFENFDISEFKHLLVNGTNVLGLRIINSSKTSGDMLMLPELRSTSFGENPNAALYYTTDGSDPRGADGNPSESAIKLPIGQTVTINANTRILTRNFDDISDRGEESRIVRTAWSGPKQYDFVVTSSELVISELNYNPSAASDDEKQAGFGRDDFEFVEILNRGSQPANLTGVELTDGVEFDFLNSDMKTLASGERLLVVSNPGAFAMRYGNELPIAGVFSGSLDNNGEDIDIVDGTGDVIFSVNYTDSDPWPVRSDGFGATLELISPESVRSEEQSKWYQWRGSTKVNGSPGRAGSGSLGVVVNEVLARTENPVNLPDSIELYNTTGTPLDISGWGLSDSADNFFKFNFPAGTTIPARGYLVLDESDFNPDNPPQGSEDFGLNGRTGDSVWLVTDKGDFVDDVHFRGTLNGESLGRFPNGSGRLSPLKRTSLGLPNTDPRVGPIVVTEVQYNPILSDAALAMDPNLDASDLEFIEIHNPTAAVVDLTEWRVRGGVDFDFPAADTLAAGATVVLLKFDPADPENINQLNAFRAHYGIDDNVRLLGGYRGLLSNADDRVLLLRPDGTDPDDPTEILRVQEDEVLYDDLAPWPKSADGTGHSLQRKSVDAFGNLGQSWNATIPSPGSPDSTIVGDFNLDGLVNELDINLLFEQMRSPNPNPSYDLTADGLVNADDRQEMIENILSSNYGDANLDRVFNSSDLVIVFQAGEYDDPLPLNSQWETGDWNGDGDFDSSDLVLAFQSGAYQTAAMKVSHLQQIRAAFAEDIAEQEDRSGGTKLLGVADHPLDRALKIDLIEESLQSLFEDKEREDEKRIEQITDSLLEQPLE